MCGFVISDCFVLKSGCIANKCVYYKLDLECDEGYFENKKVYECIEVICENMSSYVVFIIVDVVSEFIVCSADADCVKVSIMIYCIGICGVVVYKDLKDAVGVAVIAVDMDICNQFKFNAKCDFVPFSCDLFNFVCYEGQCVYVKSD